MLEDGPHPVSCSIVAVGPARRGDPWNSSKKSISLRSSASAADALGELERQVERARGPARRSRAAPPARRPPPAPDHADQHLRPEPLTGWRGLPHGPGAQHAVDARAVCDHGGRERLGELSGIGDAEQIELRDVRAAPRASERRSQTLVLPVRRGPATIRCVPARAWWRAATSSRRPISWLAGIGESLGKRSPLA